MQSYIPFVSLVFFLTHQAWGRATTWADETTACIESGVRHIFNLHISTAKSKITFQPRWNPTLKQNLIPESQFLKGARLLVKRVVFPPQRLPSAEALRSRKALDLRKMWRAIGSRCLGCAVANGTFHGRVANRSSWHRCADLTSSLGQANGDLVKTYYYHI